MPSFINKNNLYNGMNTILDGSQIGFATPFLAGRAIVSSQDTPFTRMVRASTISASLIAGIITRNPYTAINALVPTATGAAAMHLCANEKTLKFNLNSRNVCILASNLFITSAVIALLVKTFTYQAVALHAATGIGGMVAHQVIRLFPFTTDPKSNFSRLFQTPQNVK